MPCLGSLKDQGLGGASPVENSSYTAVASGGKFGKCIKTTNTTEVDTGLTWDKWNFAETSVSLCGWFKFNQAEIGTYCTMTSITSSSNNSHKGNLLGRHSYQGFAILWNTNNMYNDQAFNSIRVGASIRITDTNVSGYLISTSFVTIPFDAWIHIAAVWDISIRKIKFYINGEFVSMSGTIGQFGSNVFTHSNVLLNYPGVYSGNGPSTRIPFYCNDIRVYDHALSDKEISELAKGLVIHYKFDGQINAAVPLGYQQLEYVETAGTSYFDTGLKFNPEVDGFEIIYKGNDLTNNGMILSSGSSGTYFWLYYYSSNGTRIYANNGNGQQYVVGFPQDSLVHRAEWRNKHLYADYVDKGTITNTYSNTNGNLWLCSYGGNTTSYSFKGRIYYASIYKNGECARIFIPAKRLSDAVAGMYDIINNTFYASVSTAFTAGPVVGSNLLIDVSGNGNHATITDGTYLSISENENSPMYTSCLKCTGNSWLTAPLPQLQEFTYSFWFKRSRSSLSEREMLFTGWYGISSELNKNNTLTCRLYSTSTTRDAISTSTFTESSGWVHAVFTFRQGTGSKVYINGVFEKANSFTEGLNYTATTFTICRYQNASYQYQGCISDFRIYSKELTADEVKTLYNTKASIDNTGKILTYELIET